MTPYDHQVIADSLRNSWVLPWREVSAQLLAELKQVERERDEARRFANNEYTRSVPLEEREERLVEAEARLVKVPALVEALRYIRGDDVAGMDGHLRPEKVARDALDAWDAV